MNVALDTNAYSDFMRGNSDRVRVVRTARSIIPPLIVLAELRAGFASGGRESSNSANLQKFMASPRENCAGHPSKLRGTPIIRFLTHPEHSCRSVFFR